MKKQFVYDPLISKRQQYLLATQVCHFFFFPSSFQLRISLSLCSLFEQFLRLVSIFFSPHILNSHFPIRVDDVITAGQADE